MYQAIGIDSFQFRKVGEDPIYIILRHVPGENFRGSDPRRALDFVARIEQDHDGTLDVTCWRKLQSSVASLGEAAMRARRCPHRWRRLEVDGYAVMRGLV